MFKKVLPLSSIIALRFLGLFIVLPVLSLYALNLDGSSAKLVGIVIGGYALTQAIFQVPFGMMSDKIGRKKTIIFGLIIFIIGSIICANSTDIYSLMAGRFLQGAGAIGSVVTAMISDLVSEEQRGHAMAIMGGSIAMSFMLAMVIGPIIGGNYGVSVLFDITAILSFLAILILLFKVQNPPKIKHTYSDKTDFKQILRNPNLVKMNITNFLQKGLMTFAFMVIPIMLVKTYGWDIKELYKIYVPSVILGILAMGPSAIFAEKKAKAKEVLSVGIGFFMLTFLIMGFGDSEVTFMVAVVIFFIGFNIHEPILQSLTSKFAKVHQKGTVLGIFNSFGYIGTFLGGALGGIFYTNISFSSVTLAIAVVCVAWLVMIIKMPNPAKLKTLYLHEFVENSIHLLSEKSAVHDFYINESEHVVVIKFDEEFASEDEIKSIVQNS
jgi:predicted MFS family arabinose efflux permease